MTPDPADTIVAIASARGPAERGVVRLSGADALAVARAVCDELPAAESPRMFGGFRVRVTLDGAERIAPADVFVWPDRRSYTRQPSVEFHTVGSPPLLDALVRACVVAGARLAEPGEFTLRAVLAGRLDLTQAEGVLAVIDARHAGLLPSALDQLAGGLSAPLKTIRADLLGLLADLEAGLDFVEEEDVRFVEQPELWRRLAAASEVVATTRERLRTRRGSTGEPRVAIVGPPNIGKSRLFNALVERYGVEPGAAESLVADQRGVTRDAVTAVVEHGGVRWRLIDTAGDDGANALDGIDAAARRHAGTLREEVDLVIDCVAADQPLEGSVAPDAIGVATRFDLAAEPPTDDRLATSAVTGEGLDRLADVIAARLRDADEASAASVFAATAARCGASLESAAAALGNALAAAEADAGEELVALEIRAALDGLGRVVGEVVTDEVLGEIFGRFCIGK